MLTRPVLKPIAIALTTIGALLVLVGIVYAVTKAGSLPAFFPGHLTRHVGKKGHVAPTHAHLKLGVVLVLAAVGTFFAAYWLAFRYDPAD